MTMQFYNDKCVQFKQIVYKEKLAQLQNSFMETDNLQFARQLGLLKFLLEKNDQFNRLISEANISTMTMGSTAPRSRVRWPTR